MNFGGAPKNKLRSSKSESLETMVRPCFLAYSQIASSVALPRPHSCTCNESGYRSDQESTSRGERFSSKSSFTRSESRPCVRDQRQTPGKRVYLARSNRENLARFLRDS